MGSEGDQQKAAAMNGTADEKNELDLELRLGLPDNDENPPKNQGQNLGPAPLAADKKVDMSHVAIHPQEKKDNHVAHGEAQQNAGAWPHGGVQPLILPGLPTAIVKNVSDLFVDMSPTNNMESGMSSSSSRLLKLPVRRRRRQGLNNSDSPIKRCSNSLCNATASPMWRRGPLGPKTLCNACGIKYRKEEEKRKTQAIMQQLHELVTAHHKPAE